MNRHYFGWSSIGPALTEGKYPRTVRDVHIRGYTVYVDKLNIASRNLRQRTNAKCRTMAKTPHTDD